MAPRTITEVIAQVPKTVELFWYERSMAHAKALSQGLADDDLLGFAKALKKSYLLAAKEGVYEHSTLCAVVDRCFPGFVADKAF
jgi:hypothetical protein